LSVPNLRSSTKYIDITGHLGSGEPKGLPLHMDKGWDVGVELQLHPNSDSFLVNPFS
jgi:hypothetical protein